MLLNAGLSVLTTFVSILGESFSRKRDWGACSVLLDNLSDPIRNHYDFIAFRSVVDAISLSNARITTFGVTPTFPSRALLFHGEDEHEQRIGNSMWTTTLTALRLLVFMVSSMFRVEHITEFANRFANLKSLSLTSSPWKLGLYGGRS